MSPGTVSAQTYSAWLHKCAMRQAPAMGASSGLAQGRRHVEDICICRDVEPHLNLSSCPVRYAVAPCTHRCRKRHNWMLVTERGGWTHELHEGDHRNPPNSRRSRHRNRVRVCFGFRAATGGRRTQRPATHERALRERMHAHAAQRMGGRAAYASARSLLRRAFGGWTTSASTLPAWIPNCRTEVSRLRSSSDRASTKLSALCRLASYALRRASRGTIARKPLSPGSAAALKTRAMLTWPMGVPTPGSGRPQ